MTEDIIGLVIAISIFCWVIWKTNKIKNKGKKSNLFVSNLNDEATCDFCLSQIGEMVDDLIDLPPFEECNNPNGCRCFYAKKFMVQ